MKSILEVFFFFFFIFLNFKFLDLFASVCGGNDDRRATSNPPGPEVLDTCRRYDITTNKWIVMDERMISPRRAAASTINADGDLWILGGSDKFDGGGLGTSEILKNIDGTWKWTEGPSLPKEVQQSGLLNHCVVK